MQVFELHFNPKKKEDVLFDSFVYEAESASEKKMGNLYIVGELKQALPSNANLLNNLASAVQKEYYSSDLKKSLEGGLKDSVKKANEFLDQEARKENISWLGNLSFAILSLKDFNLNFTKTGDIKIVLLREGQATDIGKEIETQDIQPYPLKLFGNIAAGSVAKEDKILILTKEVFAFLSKSGALQQLSRISEEKELKNFLKEKQEEFSEVSGLCLLILVKEESNQKESIVLRPNFSLKNTLLAPILKIKEFFPWPRISSFKIPSFKKPEINFQSFKRKAMLIVFFAIVSGLGFIIFSTEKQKEIKEGQIILEKAEDKIDMAESLLILEKTEEATDLFKEALDLVLPLTKIKSPLKEEALNLKKRIEENID
jgi:hypothetical protein